MVATALLQIVFQGGKQNILPPFPFIDANWLALERGGGVAQWEWHWSQLRECENEERKRATIEQWNQNKIANAENVNYNKVAMWGRHLEQGKMILKTKRKCKINKAMKAFNKINNPRQLKEEEEEEEKKKTKQTPTRTKTRTKNDRIQVQ